MLRSDFKKWRESEQAKMVENAPRPVVDENLIKTLGVNAEAFRKSFDELCTRWWDASTSL